MNINTASTQDRHILSPIKKEKKPKSGKLIISDKEPRKIV